MATQVCRAAALGGGAFHCLRLRGSSPTAEALSAAAGPSSGDVGQPMLGLLNQCMQAAWSRRCDWGRPAGSAGGGRRLTIVHQLATNIERSGC